MPSTYYQINRYGTSAKYWVSITKHAEERFMQRFAKKNLKDPLPVMLELFGKSEEKSLFLNNPSLLEYFYNKYGYGRQHFYLYKNKIAFVCVKKKCDRVCILTCMKAGQDIKGPKKYRHVKKVTN